MRHYKFTEVLLHKGDRVIPFENVKEAANALRCTPSAIYQAIKQNKKILGWTVIVEENQHDIVLDE